MYTYIYIYIHTHIYTHLPLRPRISGVLEMAFQILPYTVSSHDFDADNSESRVSNPRAIVYVQFKMPFEC